MSRNFLILLISLLLVACGKGGDKGKAAENALVPVEAVTAATRAIDASYSGTATLEADREADVVAKTGGVLLKLLVEEGDTVRQGQVLARLDDASPRLSLAKAEATLRKLEADYRRADEMFGKKLLSLEEHDKIKFDLDNQRAAYDLARLELSYTQVEAPIDGVIGKRMVKEGNLIQLNQALFHIVDFDPLLGVLNVPERELNTLKPEQPVSMVVDALPGQRFPGVIERVSPVVEAASGTFRVTCRFSAQNQALKPGMFGRIDVVYDRKLDALTIPRSALIEEDGETAVFLIVDAPPPAAPEAGKDGKGGKDAAKDATPATPAAPALQAQRRVVHVGFADADYIEVRDGLKAGDRVITVGRNAVRDGTLVQVLDTTAPAAPPAAVATTEKTP
ncbi:efflux RND transporter periplasmic adaptor subunit [Tahibacter harae]|uniref:Efflux RND transporter periplasmic adaptor subunit n=1 Tax=Tahibacter harae TaxID=2963937 RepID=A0ABT1QX30_9GAMM|nr:efflux RND transporter periplasmic adaptor subunit [Tahibacter harae]MCQ4166840.1 efflux RND transporter periplasmic adaptor subunit [Tahibacter harae]